ncbi:site-specific DNA-methyltransferase [Dethiothermospora halolimnae]|uniref:site-specific DNA-methyltransferase n=1 Tax=Dethiothermospora halolimnae TaxID=3114390 RepID=UPI003CCBE130
MTSKTIEPIERELKVKTPILTTKKEIIKDSSLNNNLLIEGDNLHTLNILKSEGEKIDLIYIDPPYNTGRCNFVYSDSWKNHSSWLEFMKKRLVLAKDLLSDDGVIFISIDDREYAYLKILCDNIFGEKKYIDTIFWKKCSHKNQSKYLSSNVEQILVYGNIKKFNKRDSNLDNYKYKDENGYYRLEALRKSSYGYKKSQDYPLTLPDGSISYPDNEIEFMKRQKKSAGKNDPCWAISFRTYLKELKKGKIIFKKNNKCHYGAYRKIYAKKNNVPYSNIFAEATNQKSTKELKAMFGKKVFNYPKPTDLIKFLINLHPKKEGLSILDFFAGSGTTGHATLRLNKEDNGNRKFILCTNNENNICEDVTYKRIHKVINGYKNQTNGKFVEGIPANLLYYKAKFEEDLELTKSVA